MKWDVKIFNSNKQRIENYNLLKHQENFIKSLKKKYPNKDNFGEYLKKEIQYHYWSRVEYELIIQKTNENRIYLLPYIGNKYSVESIKIDVTDDSNFNWKEFAEYHISKQIYETAAKIDIYEQIIWRWNDFLDYCWNYHHKWQRKK